MSTNPERPSGLMAGRCLGSVPLLSFLPEPEREFQRSGLVGGRSWLPMHPAFRKAAPASALLTLRDVACRAYRPDSLASDVHRAACAESKCVNSNSVISVNARHKEEAKMQPERAGIRAEASCRAASVLIHTCSRCAFLLPELGDMVSGSLQSEPRGLVLAVPCFPSPGRACAPVPSDAWEPQFCQQPSPRGGPEDPFSLCILSWCPEEEHPRPRLPCPLHAAHSWVKLSVKCGWFHPPGQSLPALPLLVSCSWKGVAAACLTAHPTDPASAGQLRGRGGQARAGQAAHSSLLSSPGCCHCGPAAAAQGFSSLFPRKP